MSLPRAERIRLTLGAAERWHAWAVELTAGAYFSFNQAPWRYAYDLLAEAVRLLLEQTELSGEWEE